MPSIRPGSTCRRVASFTAGKRVWHPSHAALKNHGPYLVVLVELPEAGGVRLLGNLLGDAMQDVRIGAPATGVFEPHDQPFPHTLLQWQLTE